MEDCLFAVSWNYITLGHMIKQNKRLCQQRHPLTTCPDVYSVIWVDVASESVHILFKALGTC